MQNISLPNWYAGAVSVVSSPLQFEMCSKMAREHAEWYLHFAHFETLRMWLFSWNRQKSRELFKETFFLVCDAEKYLEVFAAFQTDVSIGQIHGDMIQILNGYDCFAWSKIFELKFENRKH